MSRSVPTHRLLAAACGIGVLLGAALLGGCGRASPPPLAPRPLRIGMDLWAGYYPVVIADELGYLKDENVAVVVSSPEDTHRMVADFAAGRYEAICVSIGDVVLTTRVDPDIRMILCSDESAGGDQILGHPEPDGRLNLHGKRISTTLGGFGEMLVRRFLERNGVGPEEVVLVNVDSAATLEMLERHEVDFGHTWEPYASQARAKGWQPVFSSLETPGLILDGILTHEALLRERGAEMRGLVRAWLRAVDWWLAHPEEGNALVERRTKQAPGTVSLQGIHLLDRTDNERAFNGQDPRLNLAKAVNEYVDFFIARGLLSTRPTPERLLDGRLLRP